MNFTIEECQTWMNDKNKNPKTGRIIKENGSIYKNIEKKCIEFKLIKSDENHSNNNIKNFSIGKMKEYAMLWHKNKTINPIDGKDLKKNSKIYNTLQKWYITFYDIEPDDINSRIQKIASMMSNDENLTVEAFPEMMKYKANILYHLQKMK